MNIRFASVTSSNKRRTVFSPRSRILKLPPDLHILLKVWLIASIIGCLLVRNFTTNVLELSMSSNNRSIAWLSLALRDSFALLGAWHLKGLAHLLVTLVKVHLMCLLPHASKVSMPFLGQWPKHGEVWLLNEKCSKVSFWFNAKVEQVCEIHWREKKEKKRELQLEEVQSGWRNREKHSESMSEWKRKRRHFSLLKLHTRKINWWSSHGVFGCYNHGKLEYSEEGFTTGFVMRSYLLLEIYLLYIQFIVDSSLA